MRGILFDLDETLVDRRTSLERYARTLRTDYSWRTGIITNGGFVPQSAKIDNSCWIGRYATWPEDLSRCYDARVTDAVELQRVLFD